MPPSTNAENISAMSSIPTFAWGGYALARIRRSEETDCKLPSGEPLKEAIFQVAYASRCSHEELDKAEELDDGNPVELGQQFVGVLRDNPQLSAIGRCYGTDHRHIAQIG